jgi:hypothetical protein
VFHFHIQKAFFHFSSLFEPRSFQRLQVVRDTYSEEKPGPPTLPIIISNSSQMGCQSLCFLHAGSSPDVCNYSNSVHNPEFSF